MKCRFKADGKHKEKRLSFGVYPEVSLKEADEKCTDACKCLEQNIDPPQAKKAAKYVAEEKASNTFEVVARDWHYNFKHKWSDRHANTMLRRFLNRLLSRGHPSLMRGK